MGSDSTTESAGTRLGADFLATLVHDAPKSQLVVLLNQQPPVTLPDFSTSIPHELYLNLREQLTRSTTLAALSGDDRLETLVTQWVGLQQGYARQVINEVQKGVKDQRELLGVADAELRAGEADREQYEVLRKKAVGELGDDGWTTFQRLRSKVDQLNRTAEAREQLHRAVAGVSQVEKTLTTLIDLGRDSIHYIIPSVRDAQEKLGNNAYDGPEFQPFLISTRATVSDVFMRNVPRVARAASGSQPQRSLNVDILPDVLTELVRAYEYIIDQPMGAVIVPGEIKGSLDFKILGAKGLASYLEDNAHIFGVRKREGEGSRTFTRQESGSVLGRKDFLSYMLDGKLQGPDAKQANEFYFKQLLALLREKPEAYLGGVTVVEVQSLASAQNLPVSGMYIARNIHTKTTEWGLKEIAATPPTDERYVFLKVIPTERQISYMQEAIAEFGINRFSPEDVVAKVHQLHVDYNLSRRVAEWTLQHHHEEWGYRIASSDPVQYQIKDRSTAPAKARKSVVGGDRLV